MNSSKQTILASFQGLGGGSRMTEGGHKRPLCVVRSGMAVLKMLGMLEMRANQGDPADSSRTAELKNSE